MRKLEKAAKAIQGLDAQENMYHVRFNDESTKCNILMIYQTESEYRYIGYMRGYNGDVWYLKQEEEAQTFKKLNAWSINYRILLQVDYVVFTTELYKYKISAKKALKVGEIMKFANSKEVKVYVPKHNWETKHV